MMSHLGVCWWPLGVKVQSQRTYGSVGIEFVVGVGLLLGHWRLFWAFVGPFWGYVTLLLCHLGSCWQLSGVKFQSQRTYGSVGIEVVVGVGLLLGHWRLFWAFVGPFWGYVTLLLCHVGICWQLSGVKFQSQRTHGSVEIEVGVGFALNYAGALEAMLGLLVHLRAMLGLC